MATFVYRVAKQQKLLGDLHYDTDDIRVLLLQANSDVNSEDATIQAVLARAGTTELTSNGYARQALAGEAVSVAGPRAFFDADDLDFAGLSQAASEQIVAAILFKHVTDDSDSVPIAHIDAGGFPVAPVGTLTLQWSGNGILEIP